MSVQVDFFEFPGDAVVQPCAQTDELRRLGLQLLDGQLTRLTEADNAGHVQGAGPHAAFVPTTVDDRGESHPRTSGPHVEGATAFGTVDLMGAQGQQVDAVLPDIHRDFSHPLGRVAVKEHAPVFGNPADLPNRMQGADFVVGGHDGDQHGFVGDGVGHVIRADHAVLINRQIGDLGLARPFQGLTRVEHRLVFGHTRDDVVALVLIELGHALDGQIVGLCRTAGKDDFLGLGADGLGNLAAGGIDGLFSRPAKGMVAAGGIAKVFVEVRQHGLQHPWIHRSGGLVVHVDRLWHG